MPSRFRSAVLASTVVAAALISAQPAAAQDGKDPKAAAPAASECNPNAVPTQTLAKATLFMQKAFQGIQAKQDASKDLKQAIALLTTPNPKEAGDSIGRAYYLSQAYILMLQQPSVKPIDRRGNFGIATDTSLTIDLLAAADTQITKVENGSPTCRSEITKWRQQQPWLDALNGSIGALNTEHFDSAEALAKRSLVIDRSAPYAYSVLASAANHRKDYDVAIENLKKAIELSKDTIYDDQRNSALFDLANTYSQRADAATGPDQKTRVGEAVKAWQDFMPLSTKDLQVATAVQLIRKMLKSVNDTLSYQQAYAPIIADPAHYGESALLNAGLVATQARRTDDAIKLFSAVLDKNPYQRDALNNLAASYATVKQPEKMLPLVDKLTSLDPNNADNWLLYAYAYSGLVKDNVKGAPVTKAYTDSLLKYNTKSEQLSPRLSLTAFSHTTKETSLSGSIENYVPKVPTSVSGKPLKGYKAPSVPTKTFTLTVDFLDAQGTVLGTKTATIGPVAPGSSEPFTVTLEDKDAVAFRYKPME